MIYSSYKVLISQTKIGKLIELKLSSSQQYYSRVRTPPTGSQREGDRREECDVLKGPTQICLK